MISALRFAVREIKEQEGLKFSGQIPASEFEPEDLFGEARLDGPCAVDLEFSVGGNRILMQGKFQARWQLPCNRCLAPHPFRLDGELEETYPATEAAIDAGEELRQALVLSIPERSLCRPDCGGLCATCGANLNQGPCGCPVS